jgi:hypothetical protein
MKAKVWPLLVLLLIMVFALPIENIVHGVDDAPSIAWSQIYPDFGGGQAEWVIQTSDGGFIMLCSPSSSTGIFYVLKVDSAGKLQWNQTYPEVTFGSNQPIIQTTDGGYALAANHQNSAFLLKTDASGNQLWNQTYTEDGTSTACAVIQTNDGGYALAVNSGGSVWLIKTDSYGKPQWNQTFGPTRGSLIEAHSLIQTNDGGYAIACFPWFVLIKTDLNGNKEWNNSYVEQDKNDVFSVVQTADGGFALGGWMWLRSDGGNPNFALVKTDAAGNMQWTQHYGVGTAWSMTKTVDSGFALVGSNSPRFVKADANGTMQWEIDLGGNCVIQTRDGGYAVGGLGRINETTWGPQLTKTDRDPTLPPVSPNPTMSASPSPTSTVSPSPTIPELTPAAFLALAVAACVVALTVKGKFKVIHIT